MRPITIKTWFWLSLLALGVGALIYLQIERRRVIPVPVLMYHAVADDNPTLKWVEPVEDFGRTIESLYHLGYRSILPSDLAAHQHWGKPLPRKPVIITFDDGFLDCVQNAEPILHKFGFKAICYLITKYIADTPVGRMTYETRPCLTWEEVRAARRRGTLSFGGHGSYHINVLVGGEPGVYDCAKDIERKGGFRADSFCYPFGQTITNDDPLLPRAGFTTGLTTINGVAMTDTNLNLFEIPRVTETGGRRLFRAEISENLPANQTLSIRCWTTGKGQPVIWPRIAWPDAVQSEGWLSTNWIKFDQTNTLTARYPPGVSLDNLILEFWDEFLVCPLYSVHVTNLPIVIAGQR